MNKEWRALAVKSVSLGGVGHVIDDSGALEPQLTLRVIFNRPPSPVELMLLERSDSVTALTESGFVLITPASVDLDGLVESVATLSRLAREEIERAAFDEDEITERIKVLNARLAESN